MQELFSVLIFFFSLNLPHHHQLAGLVWFSALGLSSLGWFSCSWPQVVPLATGKPNRAACCRAGAEFEITLVYIVLRLWLKYCIKFAGW